MENVLILSADKWGFTDEKTKEVRNGITLHYLTDYREDSDNEMGFKPIKVNVDDTIFDAVKKHGAPAMYSIETRTRPGKENKPTLTIVGVKFVKAVKIFDAA